MRISDWSSDVCSSDLGEYGNALVPWLYFVLGVGGAFLFYSGNLLWIESRRKRRQQAQGRAQVNMARATVGICIGFCVAVSAAFVAAQAFEALAPARVDAGIRSEEHTSELQSLMRISYAVFCLKKKTQKTKGSST